VTTAAPAPAAAIPPARVGLVTSNSVGWATLRARWERDFADLDPVLAHIEEHHAALNRFTERHGAKSVGHSLAGRAAASDAIARGARIILLTTLQNAPLVPLRNGVRYVVFGDATSAQLATLYGGTSIGLPGRVLGKRLRSLARHGTIFVCTSEWYRSALRDDLGECPAEQLVVAPFYVDVDRWTPDPDRAPSPRLQVLFVGRDLERKGAGVLYELARRADFREVDFHIVSPHATPQGDNVHAHCDLRPDSDELIRLTRSCDVFMLPTRADMSSIAAMEAAACGVPAITTDVGAIREVVLDGVTGTLLPEPDIDLFGGALATYLAAPQLRADHGSAARAYACRALSREVHMLVLRRAIERATEGLTGR